MYPEFARLVGCCTNHGAVSSPCNNDGLSSQPRVVPLFYGSIEGIHVHVDDLAALHSPIFALLSPKAI